MDLYLRYSEGCADKNLDMASYIIEFKRCFGGFGTNTPAIPPIGIVTEFNIITIMRQ